jgi:hypothetical protein
MAQDNPTQLPSVPGEDKLLDSLRNSPLHDDQRKQLWEVYHTQGDQKAFTGALNTLDMDDSTKKAMYEMRWPQPSSNTKGQSNLDTRPQAKGDVRPSATDVLNKTTGIGPASTWQRLGNVVAPFMEHMRVGGAARSEGLVDPGAAISSQHPIIKAAGEFAGGLTTPTNIILAGGTGGLSEASPVMAKLLNLGFSQQMIKGAIDQYPALKQAWANNDSDAFLEHFTHAVLGGALGLHSATEGMSTDPKTRMDVRNNIKTEAKLRGNDPVLNSAVRQAATLPDKATPLGPISETGGQQLHLDFTTKAPTEARAPQHTDLNATKSADAPLVDKQALIAPKPVDYTGQAPLIPSYRLPSEKLLATGGTQGMGPVDLSSKPLPSVEALEDAFRAKGMRGVEAHRYAVDTLDAAGRGGTPSSPGYMDAPGAMRAQTLQRIDRIMGTEQRGEVRPAADTSKVAGGVIPIERLKDGVKYATDANGVRVSIPDSIPEERVQAYATQKLAEQIKMRADLKARLQKSAEVAPPVQRDIPNLIQQLHGNFDRIADLNRQRDAAETDQLAGEIGQKHQDAEASVKSLLAGDMAKWQSKDIATFRDSATAEAQKLEAQGKAIKDLTEATIKNRGVKKDIADLRSQGGPLRYVVDPETGERVSVKPDSPTGRGARSVLDELQGRVPTSEFDSIKVAGKPEGVGDKEWADHVTKLQEERFNLKRKISDAVTIASDTGSSIAEAGIDEHVSRLKEIEGLLGKYEEPAETGRRPNVPAQLDEQGAIKAPEPLKSWTLERARLALGAKVKQIPTDEEFFQHADLRNEKGRLFRSAADVADGVLKDKRREGQAGAIGDQPLRGKVEPASLVAKVPAADEVMKRALTKKIYAHTVDDDFPAGHAGLLSEDGKIWLDSGRAGVNRVDIFRGMRNDSLSHDEIAEAVLPELAKPNVFGQASSGEPLRAMLEKGWIRKASPTDYEAWSLNNKAIHTIEMDLLRNGRHGQEITLDTRKPTGELRALTLASGWDDLETAIGQAKRRQGWTGSTGAIRGTTLTASSTVGGMVGSLVGAHLGHPYEGAAIGWGLGFITPTIADHPLFWSRISAVGSGVTRLGISMSDWLKGPEQDRSVLRDMDNIRDAQKRDLKGPDRSFVNRVAQLPGNTYAKLFDKFAFINDRPGAVQNFLMKFDPRGAAFRDLRGKLDVENSPYVSAWLAAGGGGGMAEAHLLDYKNIIKDAQSSKMGDHLNDYLNLRGYQRVYDVMQERIQEADDAINKANQALQTPKLPVEVEAGIKKALREAKAERQAVIDKISSGTLVPQPYGPTKIAADLKDMQAQLGPKFNDVKMLADRVFGLNRKALDMVHDAGIIGDAEYQKYTGRGDEYIPMHRILEQVSDFTSQTSGKGSPLYLRQQNVIKALMGSDRINRDPITASADANREAIREVIRNGVIKDYLKIAVADPNGVGSLFKPVKSGYKAGGDEGLVGVYIDGQQHTFATPAWLSESLKNVSPSSLDVIGKGPLRYFSQILRKGATMGNLAWSLPNALRHFGDMAIMSDAGLKDIRTLPRDAAGLMREWTKAVYSSVVHDGSWQEYMRSGAAYSTLQRMISPEMALDLKTLGFGQKIAKGRLIDVVQDFNAAVEDATKMTTFQRLRQAGYSEKAAAWETRRYGGGPDFAKQGNLTPAINLVSMFFNAHLQYVSRVFARAAENPARVGVALAAITGMAMALNEHNVQQKDEKGNQLIRKVPYTDRENNFVVLTGDTYQSSSGATLPVYYKVPKPSFVKFLYNPIENMLNKVAGHEERTGTQLGLQALGNLSPGQMDLQQGEVGKSAIRGVVSSLNPVIRAPLEEAMNYKTTGTGGPIVPGREQKIDARFQYGPGTSPMAQQMGEGGRRGAIAGGAEGAALGYLLGDIKGAAVGGLLGGVTGAFGVSPRRAEHVIDTTTAGAGRMATGFVDPFLAAVKQTHMEGPEKLANTMVAGPILGRFVSTSIDQQEQSQQAQFYKDAQAAQQPMQTLEFLKKNHPEQISSYIQSHKDDLWKAQIATNMQSRLSQITNTQKTIEQNQQMSDVDRTEALKNLHAVKMQILSVFTKVMRPSPQVPQAAAMPGQGQGAAR